MTIGVSSCIRWRESLVEPTQNRLTVIIVITELDLQVGWDGMGRGGEERREASVSNRVVSKLPLSLHTCEARAKLSAFCDLGYVVVERGSVERRPAGGIGRGGGV